MNIYSDYLFDFFMFAQKTRAGSGGFVSSFTVNDVGVLGDLQICVNRKDEEATTRIVKSLMWTLMKREYKGKGESMYQDPFMQFLIGASIQRDGRLRALSRHHPYRRSSPVHLQALLLRPLFQDCRE